MLIRISPDGRFVAFVALGPSGVKTVLYLRRLNSTESQPIAGTENAFAPFWSSDSRYIGFFADQKVKKVNVAGGAPQVLCATTSFANGTWNQDGVILFSDGSVIRRVSADGGEAAPVTKLDASPQDASHRWPSFLPDGRHFTYSILDLKQPEKHAIVAGSLDSSETIRLIDSESMAAYAPPGFLIFQRSGTLLAQPFDATRLRVTGDPILLAEGIAHVPRSGRAAFDVSQTGVLVYRTGQATAGASALSWFDRQGKPLGIVGEPGVYHQVRLSPDETRVAVARVDSTSSTWDIWTLDLSDNILTRLSFDPEHEQNPLWSHDGRSVAYVSQRMAKFDFFQKAVGGTTESILFESAEHPKYLDDLSPDGRFLLYNTTTILYAVPLDGDRQPVVLDQTPFKKGEARFSPDGKWVAYESNESGATELYVASFPKFDNRRQLTAHGGRSPRWRANGREVFYLTPDGRLMAVDVKTSPSITFGVPHVLFQTPLGNAYSPFDLYAVTRDGQRFLFPVAQRENALPRPITVVLNWTAGLKKP
jgi:Tol biopolymer transport system component